MRGIHPDQRPVRDQKVVDRPGEFRKWPARQICPAAKKFGIGQDEKRQAHYEFDDGVAGGYGLLAITTSSFEPEPAEDWHIIVGADRVVALGAVRRLPDDRHPQRHTVGDDIQKAADAGADKAEPEGGDQVDYCVGGHLGIRFGRLC